MQGGVFEVWGRCMDEFPCMHLYCNQPSDLYTYSILSSLKVSMLFINVQLYPYFNLGLSKDLFDINIFSYSSMFKTLCHYYIKQWLTFIRDN